MTVFAPKFDGLRVAPASSQKMPRKTGLLIILLLGLPLACVSEGVEDAAEKNPLLLFPSRKTCLMEGVKATECSQPCLASCQGASCARACLCACNDKDKQALAAILNEEQREANLVFEQAQGAGVSVGAKLAGSSSRSRSSIGSRAAARRRSMGARMAHAKHRDMMVDGDGFNWDTMYDNFNKNSAEYEMATSPVAKEASEIGDVYDPIYDLGNKGPPSKLHASWWNDKTRDTMGDGWWKHNGIHEDISSEH